VSAGGRLLIEGAPDFGGTGADGEGNLVSTRDAGGQQAPAGNFVTLPGYTSKVNGGKAYPAGGSAGGLVRQDIYLAEDNEGNPQSLTVAGDLVDGGGGFIGEGAIWVWAERPAHCEQLMPFARLAEGVEFEEVAEGGAPSEGKLDAAHLRAFRNACDDDKSNNGTGEWLYGTVEGDVEGLVYWYGIGGERKVVLRKVSQGSDSALAGARFNMYRGNGEAVYELRDREAGTSTRMDDQLLVSGAGGAFWAGVLPYGTYYLEETAAPAGYAARWFYYILDGDYQVMSAGHADREAAKAAAKADNDAIKAAKSIVAGKSSFADVAEDMRDRVRAMLEMAGRGDLAQ
jgi:hypothetical protein